MACQGVSSKYHRKLEDIGRAASMDTENWPLRRSVEENLTREPEDMGCVASVETEIWPVRGGIVENLAGYWRISAVQRV